MPSRRRCPRRDATGIADVSDESHGEFRTGLPLTLAECDAQAAVVRTPLSVTRTSLSAPPKDVVADGGMAGARQVGERCRPGLSTVLLNLNTTKWLLALRGSTVTAPVTGTPKLIVSSPRRAVMRLARRGGDDAERGEAEGVTELVD